jgi:hypothetical protein
MEANNIFLERKTDQLERWGANIHSHPFLATRLSSCDRVGQNYSKKLAKLRMMTIAQFIGMASYSYSCNLAILCLLSVLS